MNRTCQQLIRDHLNWCKLVVGRPLDEPCMFDQVEGCVPDELLEDSDSFMTMFSKVNKCHLRNSLWCRNHCKRCPVVGAAAATDYDCAGLPCWDYSAAGLRKKEEGSTKRVFIAYAKRHIWQQTPLLLIENVKDWRQNTTIICNNVAK